jgi:hypothetical protein
MDPYEILDSVIETLKGLSLKLSSMPINNKYSRVSRYNTLAQIASLTSFFENDGDYTSKTFNRLWHYEGKIKEKMALLDNPTQKEAAMNSLIKMINKASDVQRSELQEDGRTNSEEFLKAEVKRLKEEKATLLKSLEKKKTSEDYSRILDDMIAEDVRKKLSCLDIKIAKKKRAIEKKSETKDAQDTMKSRIEQGFKQLGNGILPLKNEEKRLTTLYRIYFWTSVAIFLALVVYEIIFLYIWNGTVRNWFDMAPFYLPVPLIAGLLWAFIHQMNRAQIQLLSISKVIYRIKYIEGLLLAINQISYDVNGTSLKIVDVMNRMIDSFLKRTGDDIVEGIKNVKEEDNLKEITELAKVVKDLK